jgi:hypothetical protein
MDEEPKLWSKCGEWLAEPDGLFIHQVCPSLPPSYSCADCGEWAYLLCDQPHAITWLCSGCETRWRFNRCKPLPDLLRGLWPSEWLVWTVGRDWKPAV